MLNSGCIIFFCVTVWPCTAPFTSLHCSGSTEESSHCVLFSMHPRRAAVEILAVDEKQTQTARSSNGYVPADRKKEDGSEEKRAEADEELHA